MSEYEQVGHEIPILVTGAAGFIGFHLSKSLLEAGGFVLGLDNLNDYYDVNLKKDRLSQLTSHGSFNFVELDIADRKAMMDLFAKYEFRRVIHLAAQAGVRYSLENPHVYADSNLVGFLNVLEGCRHAQVEHLVFASSSSVYGGNTRLPFSVRDNVDHPMSLYAATKKANELMAHSYAHLYGLPCTGLRFFTVYGPWGRPDMAMFIFTRAILNGDPIDVYNFGHMKRDFTYIDDIVEGIIRVADKIPCGNQDWSEDHPDPSNSTAPYKVYNVGNHQPVDLSYLIERLEQELGKSAKKRLLPMQPGDVPNTHADIDDLFRDVGFRPQTPLEIGVSRFVEWYRWRYKL